MRTVLATLIILVAASATDRASAEILYPWCRQPSDGGNYCGYSSEAQCQANSGHGSFCIQNPRYQAPAAAVPAKRRSR
jgi:hypothetical protein